ncbi:TrgA family protein [uncultured Limimaricola sp.]|uniref:TrgA family protein n=1 Tax=uncultured Limimaricola sp. TaxID=2211667 RepID=UPI0030FA14AA
MPTAAKLVGALLFAALGYVATLVAVPFLSGVYMVASAPVINALIGAITGWFIAGPRAGEGWQGGISNGVTATISGLLLVGLVHGVIFMWRSSMRGRYHDPMDALEATAEFWLTVAGRLAVPQMIGLLLVGGVVIGLALEFTRVRAH